MSGRRVVITGMGAVCSLGQNVSEIWQSLLAGKSGVRHITLFDATGFDVHFASQVEDFDPAKWLDSRSARRMDRCSHFAIAASQMSVEDSGLDIAKEDPFRVGVSVGTGIGGIGTTEEQHKILVERGPSRISPFLIPRMMVNAASGEISIRFFARGPTVAVATACASASNALGDAFRTVQYDEADVMIAGGTEAAVTPLGLAGFCSMKALSRRNEAPELASRPFDKGRDGFVLGEGAGFLILEELEHAKKRGARVYAEFLGYGATADATHITAPDPEGLGASECMARALSDSRRSADELDYINAHGTSTPLNDVMETVAIKRVFGERAKEIPISSTKSMIGHLLGASGALELISTVMSVYEDVIPPTINYETPDPECDLDYVPNKAREARVSCAMSNSFGFGGHNATLVVGKFVR